MPASYRRAAATCSCSRPSRALASCASCASICRPGFIPSSRRPRRAWLRPYAPRHLSDHYRGFAGHTGYLRPAWGAGWALVGDAGYFKDPITAHGISDALRDAELLARAIEGGADADFAAYQTIRDELSLPLFEYADEIASFAWDFARLQMLHRKLSDEMAKEVLYLRELTEVVKG